MYTVCGLADARIGAESRISRNFVMELACDAAVMFLVAGRVGTVRESAPLPTLRAGK
jgi:hypothetical protein